MSAISLTVGPAKKSRTVNLMWKVALIRLRICSDFSELPPRLKKLSSRPGRSMRSTPCHSSAIRSSSAVSGGSDTVRRAARSAAVGAGRPRRSSFPDDPSGRASRATYTLGSM